MIGERNTSAQDVDAVLSELSARSTFSVSVKPNPVAAQPWIDRVPPHFLALPRTAHVLDLSGGLEQTWSDKFASRARTYVRKAERYSLAVESDTTGAFVPVFYDLYMRSVERWARQDNVPILKARRRAAQQDPLHKFVVVARRMKEACKIWVARLDGRPAAAIIVLRQGANASYWRGAMDEDIAGESRANYLLHSKAIEDACSNGCQWYHMGETGTSTSLAQFKTRFGSKPINYFEYRIERLPISATREALLGAQRKLRARLSREDTSMSSKASKLSVWPLTRPASVRQPA